MKLNAASVVSVVAVALLLIFAPAFAQQSVMDAKQPTANGAPKQPQGFVEFALRGINPADRDYGACVDDARRLLLQETIRRAYFWSNLLAIAVAICLIVVVIHQHRLMARREGSAADVITQYRNALARAEHQVNLATQRNHELMQGLAAAPNSEVEGQIAAGERAKQRKTAAVAPTIAPASPTSTPTASASAEKRTHENTTAPQPLAATTDVVSKNPVVPGNQMGLFGNEGDFVAKINALQQQLSTSQERERQLRRQLNDSEIRYQKGREKSRSTEG